MGGKAEVRDIVDAVNAVDRIRHFDGSDWHGLKEALCNFLTTSAREVYIDEGNARRLRIRDLLDRKG